LGYGSISGSLALEMRSEKFFRQTVLRAYPACF